ncbi:MAG: response regulator transcription factor [Actinobacteria bacterium]|nr:response regulator transcription factor [Actinomycetota bacterium]
MGKIRVLLADDHTIFRAGVRVLLELSPDLEVVGEAMDGADAVAKARQLLPDVILMDVAMPGMDGLTAARQVMESRPECKVLLLTQYENKEYIMPALRLGVAGYVLKRAAADELVSAIRAVHEGKSFLDPSVAKIVMEAYRSPGRPDSDDSIDSLTEREREIMILLAKGRTLREIAELLQISPKTVDFHRSNLMQKLGLHNRADLARYAVKHGLV